MKTLEKSCIQPQLYTPKRGSKDTRWFVYFSVAHPVTGKLSRKKVYDNLNQISDDKKRMERVKELLNFYRRKLNNGWNPYLDSKKVLYKESGPKEPEFKQPQITISEHLFTVLKDEQKRIRKGTFSAYQSQIRIFQEWLQKSGYGSLEITQLTKEHAKQFVGELEKHNTTVNAYTANMRHLFRLLMEKEVILTNPFVGIKKLPTTKTPKQYFSTLLRNQLQSHVSAKYPEMWLCIQLIYYCFIRPKEIRDLRIGDIDLESNTILLRGEISKNKKSEQVVIPSQLRKNLLSWGVDKYPRDYFLFGKDGKPDKFRRGKNHFGNTFRIIIKELRITGNYSLYSWKHTGAVMFYRQTKDIKTLQLQMRHHSLEETDKYLKGLGALESEALLNFFPTIS
ncbi:tyrosine-type recombinase/integrase [Larkinella rosea]|uniref:Site-specific integrase n=1 Tax=Larkinella rosea TaxID=2025312 RepID=A0A3P1BSJ6_9BACT|nr:site-specific integrase [Larkinella rosea]RRB03893.1 site-specific integrase [Larkinella rosea]